MIKTFCNVCEKEAKRNMVHSPLLLTYRKFNIEVVIKSDDRDFAVCYPCLMKMLTQKPKRKYVKKGKKREELTLSATTSDTPTNSIPLKKKGGRSKREPSKPDISTFSIKTPEPGSNELYILGIGEGIGEGFVEAKVLKEGALRLLKMWEIDQQYVEDAPDSEEKTLLLSILKGEK